MEVAEYEPFNIFNAEDITKFAPTMQMTPGSGAGKLILKDWKKNADLYANPVAGVHEDQFSLFMEGFMGALEEKSPDLFEEAGALVMGSGTANQNALTTVLVANFIEQKIRPTLMRDSVFRTATGFNVKGATGIKVPINTLQAAAALPDSGDISSGITSENYLYTQIDLGWIYEYTRLTVQTMHSSSAPIIADQLGLMGYGLAKKQDYDGVAALYAATPESSGWTNSNGKFLGDSTELTFDTLNDCMGEMSESGDTDAGGCFPDKFILSPSRYHQMLQDDDLRAMISFAPHGAGTFAPGYEPMSPGSILGMDIIPTHATYHATSASTHRYDDMYLVDSKNAGWMIQGVPMQVIDNPTPTGFAGRDIVAYTSYGFGVSQTKGVYRIVAHGSDA